jgi:Taurine catabolism dioxygenase TauD, TfdA family
MFATHGGEAAMSDPIRPITGANVWHGTDMAQSSRWQRHLSPVQLAEIDAALAAAKRRGLSSWEAMTAGDFPLPGLAVLFDDIREELENGSGLLILRGIDPSHYTLDDARIVYAGIARQLGTPVFSNRGGEIMRDIRDVGQRYGELKGADGAFLSSYSRTLSNGSLRYHTDRCDVVALFCIRQAMTGGLSKLCSSPAVHNAMLERRPELCVALYENVWRSRFGEEDEGDTLGYPLPVWDQRDGKFTSHYSRTFVEAGQRRPEAPRVSAAQWEALDMLSDLADELSFEMSFAPGDIQFVNNHVIYHARGEFEDDAGAGRDRLLLRLWLSMPNSRALPQGHEVLWRSIEAGGLRGGIGQTAAAPLR